MAGATPDSSDRVCYRIDDPLVISGTIVTSSATLGVSPPCRIDAGATRLCVSASADAVDATQVVTQLEPEAGAGGAAGAAGEGDAGNAGAAQRAELCYVIECPDDVAPRDGAVADAFGAHSLKGMRASTLCVPATLGASDEDGAVKDHDGGEAGGTDADADAPSLIGKDQGCGDANADGGISASDALAALRTAVGISSGCGSCACDVNDSGSITAGDALAILRAAVGQPVTLGCPEGPFSVVWDGGGDGTSWQDRLNWGGDAVPRFCDSVTIDIAAEASVVYASQTLSILALTSAEDLTLNSGSLTLRQASSVTGKLSLVAATLTVDDTLALADFDWTGGTIADAGTTTVSGALTIDNAVGRNFNGGTLTHTGLATWSEGTIFVTNGSVFDNPVGATLEISGDIDLHYAGGTVPSFVNAGTLLKSGGSSTSEWSVPTTSTGTIDLRAGTLRPTGGLDVTGPVTVTAPGTLRLEAATNVFAASSAVSGTGAVALTGGTNTFSGSYTISSALIVSGGTNKFDGPGLTIGELDLSGGTLEFDAPVEVTDAFNWRGGTLQGDDTTTVSGALTIDSAVGRNFNGGTLTHTGLATWSEGTIFVTNGSVFDNPAGATLEVSGDIDLHYAGGTVPSFVNGGTFTKSGGSGTTQWSVPFTNDGDVELVTGLLNCTNGYTQSSAGTLTTAVAGTDPSLIGRLQANTATLDGELALDVTGGYAPQLGDTFTVLGYSSRSGAFATISGTSLGGGLTAQETYGATELSFEVQ